MFSSFVQSKWVEGVDRTDIGHCSQVPTRSKLKVLDRTSPPQIDLFFPDGGLTSIVEHTEEASCDFCDVQLEESSSKSQEMDGNTSSSRGARSWNICSREKEHFVAFSPSMSTDARLRFVALWSSSVARIGAAVFMIFALHILMSGIVWKIVLFVNNITLK
jgi:hypothetical protein